MKVATRFGSDLAVERVVASACEHEYLAAPPQGHLPHRRPRANRHSGDGVLDSVGFEPIGAKEKIKSRRKNEPDLAALARRASGSAGEAVALATEVDSRGHEKNATKKEAAGRRLGAGKRRGSFLERAGSRAPADAQPNTRA